MRYYARSASDRTDNWPNWFVADAERGGLNVTPSIVPGLLRPGATLVDRELAIALAGIANGMMYHDNTMKQPRKYFRGFLIRT